MFKKDLFKVEEIGTCPSELSIFLKGSKNSILHGKQPIVRQIDSLLKEYIPEIESLTESQLYGEAELVRNLYKLAGYGIKEMGITTKKTPQKVRLPISNLKFLDNYHFSEVLPQASLMHLLVSKGIGNDVSLYCDEGLRECPEVYYNSLIGLKFQKIEDIRFKDKPEVHVDEKDYERLDFEEVLMTCDAPKSLIYKKGPKKVGFSFPLNKVTIDKFMRDHRLTLRILGHPTNPEWIADSMSIIDFVMKKAGIEVDSIYVNSNIKGNTPNSVLMYNPGNAKVVLKKYRKKIVTPATGEQAISLSYLHSKDVFLHSNRSYVV